MKINKNLRNITNFWWSGIQIRSQIGPQMAPRKPKRPPRRPKRPPRRPKSAPRRPRRAQDGPRGRQDAPRGSQEASRERSKRPKSLMFICFFEVFGLLAFSEVRRSKTAQRLPKRLQDGPRGPGESRKMAQESLKTTPEPPMKVANGPEKAPRRAQDAPRAFQDAHG